MTGSIFLSVVNPSGIWMVEPCFADRVSEQLLNSSAAEYRKNAEETVQKKKTRHEQLQAKMQENKASTGSYFSGMVDANGILAIQLRGVISEAHSSWDEDGIVLSDLVPFLELADKDPAVKGIFQSITSPGGIAVPSLNAGEIISKINETTPIISYYNGLCASAALAITQGSYVISSPHGIIGGVAAVYRGMDRKVNGEYERPLVLASGKKKIEAEARGEDGFLTAEAIAAKQREVDQLGQAFVEFITTQRKLTSEQKAEIEQGGYWIGGKAAVKAGLVDEVLLWSDAKAKAPKLFSKIRKEKGLNK